MSIILGLDVGEIRVGVALADDTTGVIIAHQALVRAKGGAEKELLKIINERGISIVVAGLPLGINGEHTPQCDKVISFCNRLTKRSSITIHYVDEFLTSEEAKQRSGISGKKERELRQKGVLDSEAASIILQSFFSGTR